MWAGKSVGVPLQKAEVEAYRMCVGLRLRFRPADEALSPFRRRAVPIRGRAKPALVLDAWRRCTGVGVIPDIVRGVLNWAKSARTNGCQGTVWSTRHRQWSTSV